MRRSLLLSGALLAGLVVGPAHATPGGGVRVEPLRAFVLDDAGSFGFSEVEVSLWQSRGGAAATGTGGGATGTAWRACVFAWLKQSFFSDCGTPSAVSVDVPATGAGGTVAFTLRDDFWGDTAEVRLALTDSGTPPLPSYALDPYVSGTYGHGQLAAGLTRVAPTTGTVTLKTVRGKAKESAVRQLPDGAGTTVSDLLDLEVTGYA